MLTKCPICKEETLWLDHIICHNCQMFWTPLGFIWDWATYGLWVDKSSLTFPRKWFWKRQ